MNETRIFADAYQTTFADPKEMLEFLAQRAKESSWIRKPTRTLRLVPAIQEAGKMKDTVGKNWEEILEDTENNTQLALKIKGETYPVRTCAIRTILDRAGISGSGLRKLETATYAKVVNYCLKVAKGDALIKIADGKVSAVHGGDHHDYSILDMRAVFEMTMQFLNTNFPGNSYVEGSGMFDHSIVSAMWELGGNQELLDTYRDALSDHGISDTPQHPSVIRFSLQYSETALIICAIVRTVFLSVHPVIPRTRCTSVSSSGSSRSITRFILEMTDWFICLQPA